MLKHRLVRVCLVAALVVHARLLLGPSPAALAADLEVPDADADRLQLSLSEPRRSSPFLLEPELVPVLTRGGANSSIPAQQAGPTTLEVSIISSPYAILDHNDPSGTSETVPQAFVVEAVITNTGTTTATDLTVQLDYNEDPANNWVLLAGEYPGRTLDELAPDETYYAYWFARYSTVIGARHQYTVGFPRRGMLIP